MKKAGVKFLLPNSVWLQFCNHQWTCTSFVWLLNSFIGFKLITRGIGTVNWNIVIKDVVAVCFMSSQTTVMYSQALPLFKSLVCFGKQFLDLSDVFIVRSIKKLPWRAFFKRVKGCFSGAREVIFVFWFVKITLYQATVSMDTVERRYAAKLPMSWFCICEAPKVTGPCLSAIWLATLQCSAFVFTREIICFSDVCFGAIIPTWGTPS